jgi:HK97 family phage major capsid protein
MQTKLDATIKRPNIVVGKDRVEDDPMHGFKGLRHFLDTVLDAGRQRTVPKSLLRLTCVKDGRRIDSKTVGSDEQSVFADPYGGFLVPSPLLPDFLRLEPEADPIAGKTKPIPMQTPSVQIGARVDKTHTSSVSGGLTVTRKAESQAATSSRMEVEKIKFEAHTLMGYAFATEEILMDSPHSFSALLSQGFSDEMTAHMIDERLNGAGVGEFLGIMKAPCLIDQAKETGQVATTIVYENIVKMRARCWRYDNAIWLANHDTLPELMQMNKTVGVGGVPIWHPSGREDHADILLGRPIMFTEFCQTLGTSGDIVLCNWGEYLEGLYQPLQSAESIHVRFAEHERAFKFFMRNAGAPWWRSALTPKNSTTTLGPFISLATRS